MSKSYTRKDLMTKKCTHREYFGQFVTKSIIDSVVYHIGADKIECSADEHMNDIPLSWWHKLHPWLLTGVIRSFSVSNTVCVAKEAARQYLEKSK